MNNYTKGRCEEEVWQKKNVPIPNLPDDFTWMQVSGGSKIRNLLEAAWKEFNENPSIVWSASGPGLNKAITCAEMTKRKFGNLKQETVICYREIKEYWDPKTDKLDQLVVIREVPAIHIYLRREQPK